MTQPRLQDVTPQPTGGAGLSLEEIVRRILAGSDLSQMTTAQIAELINELVRTLPSGSPTAAQIGAELFKTPGLTAAVEANQTRARALPLAPTPSPLTPTDEFAFEQAPLDVPQAIPQGVPQPVDQPFRSQQGITQGGPSLQSTLAERLQLAERNRRNVFQSFIGDVLPGGIGPSARSFAESQLPQLEASFFSQLRPESFIDPVDPRQPEARFREFVRGGGQQLSAGQVGQNLTELLDVFQNPGRFDPLRVGQLRETFTPQRIFETALAPFLAGVSPGFRQQAENVARRQFSADIGGGADPEQFLARLVAQGGTLQRSPGR